MNQLEFDFGVAVLSEYDEDGNLGVQHDAPGLDDKAGTIPDEALMPGGLLHRPLDPEKDARGEPTTGTGLLMWTHGDRRHAMPLNDDPRSVPKRPKLRKGGTALYGGAGEYLSFVLIDGLDPAGTATPGTIMMSVPYSSAGSKKAHTFSMLVRDAGQEAVILAHGEGHGLTLTKSGKRSATLKNASGSASVGVNDDGVAILGKTKLLGALTVGGDGAEELVLAKALLQWMIAMEIRVSTAVGAGPPTVPAATIAAAMTTKLMKGR